MACSQQGGHSDPPEKPEGKRKPGRRGRVRLESLEASEIKQGRVVAGLGGRVWLRSEEAWSR